MKAVIISITLVVLMQCLTAAALAQAVRKHRVVEENDDDMEHNEGAMAIQYWSDLEKNVQQKNIENGLNNVDRSKARLDAFKARRTESLMNVANNSSSTSGSWSQVNQSPSNVGMGRIEDVAFDASNANIFYVATSGGGVWKTTDGGATYIPRTDGLPTGGISSIVIDPNNNNILYIYAGGGLGSNSYPGVVYKSTDASYTWTQTGYANMPPSSGYELKIHPTNSNILFLGTDQGLYRSTNAGVSWTQVLAAAENGSIYDIEFKPGNPSVIYACGQHIIYVSESNGDLLSWGSSFMPTPPTTVTSFQATRIAVSAASPNDLFFAMGVNSPKNIAAANGTVFYVKGTYSTATNSFSWGFAQVINACGRLCFRSGGGRAYGDIYVSPTNSSNVMVGGVDNFTTTNGGNSWVLKSKDCNNNLSRNMHDDVGKIRSAFGFFYVATDGGLHRQVENYNNTSAPWTDLSSGMEITQLYTHDASPLDPQRYLYANQDNGVQVRTSSIDYNGYVVGDGTACKIYKFNKELYYGCIQSGEGMRRHNTDGTTNFVTPNLGNIINGFDRADTAQYTGTFNYSNAFEMDQNNSTTIYAVKRSFYISQDRGDNWIRFSISGATNTHNLLRVAKSNSNRIYVQEDGTNIFQRSDDGAVTWTDITASKPFNGIISDLVINPVNSLDIYVTYRGNTSTSKVYHSANGGASWINLSYGLPNVDVNCIALENNPQNGIYVGNDLGVYYRDNDTAHWINFSNGLPVVPAMHIVYDDINSKLSVATYGRGIWVSDAYDAASCVTNRSLAGTYNYRNVYTASNDITATGTVYGDANTTIKFSGGHQVIMSPGFSAQRNSDFTASLEGCAPAASPFFASQDTTVATFNIDSMRKKDVANNRLKKASRFQNATRHIPTEKDEDEDEPKMDERKKEWGRKRKD